MSDVKPDVRAIFCEALEKQSPSEVAKYLDKSCGNDAQLRAQVKALLSAHGEVGNFLGGGPAPTTDEPISEQAGSVIGPYKLLQQIGEGGMGVVYMAEQSKPVERRVALKIIKLGMDTRQVIARFEAERQALAMMDHPNITKVLDAGVTDSGRPYFVMELVKGMPITEYCDEQRLTARQRLDLFLPVCRAVQHAHQKGIIHRDLKPSNVMVAMYDDQPVPKVIDFGVAKATSQKLTEKTMFTQYGQIVGTLEYMSPEQAKLNQLDIDTRSDIYSLGVLLYELLTGTTPFDKQRLRSSAFEEIMRIIREEDPPKPSTRLRSSTTLPSVAANRGTEVRKLSASIRGELDWIVMKALEKDRTRRYETANGLAMDIENYLSDEQVMACPPSASYRFRKFARRNTAALATALIVSIALLLGTAVSTWQAVRANQERQAAIAAQGKARREAERANRAADAETAARRSAQRAEALSRRQLYTSQMNVALQAWDAANAGRTLDLLNRNMPQPGEEDRRGFEWYYLWRLCHEDSGIFNHWGYVYAVTISPDGKTVASAGRDRSLSIGLGELRLWDAATGRLLATLVGHEGMVDAVAFSSDGQTLASCGAGEVKLWDVLTRREKATFKGFEGYSAVKFSPRANILAVAGKALDLFDLEEGKRTTLDESLDAFPALIQPLAFSPEGAVLAAAGTSGKVKLWDLQTGHHRELELADHNSCVALSPNGNIVASASDDGTVRLWDASNGELFRVLEGHTRAVLSLAFSSTGHTLATGSLDNTARIWETSTGTELETLRGNAGPVYCLAYARNGKILATGSRDRTVKLWNLQQQRSPIGFRLHDHNPRGNWSQFADLVFSPDASRLISFQSTYDAVSSVKLCNIATGNQIKLFTPEGLCVGIAFAEDGAPLALIKEAEAVKLRDVLSGRVLQTFPDNGRSRWAFSSDGQTLLSKRADGRLILWRADSGKQLLNFQAHPGRINCIVFSADDKCVASAGVDQEINVWDARTGQRQSNLHVHDPQVTSLAFCPTDNATLASGSFDGIVKLWDSVSGAERATLEGHSRSVFALAFSPDGQRLASGSFDGTVKLWETQSGDELGTFKWNDESIVSLAFSRDGKTLAAGSKDGMVVLAHAATEQEVIVQHHEREARQAQLGKELKFTEPARNALRLYDLASRQFRRGRHEDAEQSLEKSLGLLQATADYLPVFGPFVYDAHAWMLATCTDQEFRHPEHAVYLAEKAVQLRPQAGRYWSTLGVARYRQGNRRKAIEALMNSQQLIVRRPFRAVVNGFFLAMSYWQLGDEDEARKWFNNAANLMEKESFAPYYEEQLRHIRDEAAQLLDQVGEPSA